MKIVRIIYSGHNGNTMSNKKNMQFLYHNRSAARRRALPVRFAEGRRAGNDPVPQGYCVCPFFLMISSYRTAHCMAFSSSPSSL